MPRTTTPQPERKPELLNQYRAIGPAAILAALLCAAKTRPEEASAAKPA